MRYHKGSHHSKRCLQSIKGQHISTRRARVTGPWTSPPGKAATNLACTPRLADVGAERADAFRRARVVGETDGLQTSIPKRGGAVQFSSGAAEHTAPCHVLPRVPCRHQTSTGLGRRRLCCRCPRAPRTGPSRECNVGRARRNWLQGRRRPTNHIGARSEDCWSKDCQFVGVIYCHTSALARAGQLCAWKTAHRADPSKAVAFPPIGEAALVRAVCRVAHCLVVAVVAREGNAAEGRVAHEAIDCPVPALRENRVITCEGCRVTILGRKSHFCPQCK